MTTLEIAFSAAAAIGTAVASAYASRKGGKEGSSGALNGTAEAVRRIEHGVELIGGKLDGHIDQTASNFRNMSDRVSELSDRVSHMEGWMNHDEPKQPMRAARRKPT